MHMVDILHTFIRAERTGNWKLHLQAVHDMLPYFAAAGHNPYAKSAYLYLQSMYDIQKEHPEVYTSFQGGLHVVQRSDRYWAGLSTDLAIEQVLMHSVKTCGGLTRGRGMSESQHLIWLLSMPACADVNNAMQNLTGVMYHTSHQHKDTTKARQERDFKDTNKLVTYLSQRNPYGPTVNFDSTMIAKLKKEEFLANKENKKKVIHLLGNKLQQSGCSTIHTEGDVDLLIVQTAIQSSRSITTVLVGDDTDLLVLLCYHAKMNANELFFKAEPKQRLKTRKT